MRRNGQALLAAKFRQAVDEAGQFGVVVDRPVHRNLLDLLGDAARAGILADGGHHVGGLDTVYPVLVEEDDGGNRELPRDAFLELPVAVRVGVDVVGLSASLLQAEHPRGVEVDEESLRLHVELDDPPLSVVHDADEAALQAEDGLVVFLRGRGVLEEEHRVPFGDRASGEHAVDRERERLDALPLAVRDRLHHVGNLDETLLDLGAGDVDDPVFAQLAEGPPVFPVARIEKGFQGVAGGAIRQDADDVMAHLALLDLLVFQERENPRFVRGAADRPEKIDDLLLVDEFPVEAPGTRVLLHAHRPEQFAETARLAGRLQLLELLAGGLVEVEGEADHLRKAVVGIVPLLVRDRKTAVVRDFPAVLVYLVPTNVVLVPLPLCVEDVRERTEGNDVLLLEFAPHQDAVGGAGEVEPDFRIERLDGPGRVHGVGFFGGVRLLVFRGDAQSLAVFLGAGGEVGLVDDEKVDRIRENLLVARLDRIALKVLERREKQHLVAGRQFFGDAGVLGVEVLPGKKDVFVAEVRETKDRVPPFARHVRLAGNDHDEAGVQLPRALERRHRLAEAHDGIHQQVRAPRANRRLEARDRLRLVRAKMQIHGSRLRFVFGSLADVLDAVERVLAR